MTGTSRGPGQGRPDLSQTTLQSDHPQASARLVVLDGIGYLVAQDIARQTSALVVKGWDAETAFAGATDFWREQLYVATTDARLALVEQGIDVP